MAQYKWCNDEIVISMNSATYQGQCLCGKVKYQAQDMSKNMAHCHCTMCRKFHGAAFSTYGSVLRENLVWLNGENYLKSYVASNGSTRKFCQNCGSSLVFISAGDEERVELALATLDNPPDLRPDAHIYTESKVSWLSINDDLPKYDQSR